MWKTPVVNVGPVVGIARQKSDLKPPLKEKFVSLYEEIFSGRGAVPAAREKGIEGRAELQRFWDELFLLKVNEAFLAQCVAKTPEGELVGRLKGTLNDLFGACVRYLSDDSFIRVAHALETAAILLREIFKKRFNEQGFTIISLLAGSLDHADAFFKRMIGDVSNLLMRTDVPILIKSLGLRLYLVILTATDNVNSNSIASYFFVNVIFDAITSVLTSKILDDAHRLELDGTLVLLLLLLWRESENAYTAQIASPVAPLPALLHTVNSLLGHQRGAGVFTLPGHAKTTSVSSGVGGLWDYVSSWMTAAAEMGTTGFGGLMNATGITAMTAGFGTGGGVQGAGTGDVSPRLDPRWCSSTAGIILVYFLIYHNPVMKSQQAWALGSVPTTPGQSLAVLWWHVFRQYLGVVSETVSQAHVRGVLGVLRTKLCLLTLRCIVEESTIIECLNRSDIQILTATVAIGPPVMGPGVVVSKAPAPVVDDPNFRSVLGFVVDLVVGLIGMVPRGSHMDADMYSRAIIIISVVLSFVKSRGKPWGPLSIDWPRLWKSLISVCNWASQKEMFQKPGVPELSAQAVGVLEFALGSAQELMADSEDIERLHAIILAHMSELEKLEATAREFNFGGDDSRPSISIGVRLMNISTVRAHYELQLSIMGAAGKATEIVALHAVKKKGSANLKLKPRHTGAGHTYMEGTAEYRTVNGLIRPLISEYKKMTLISSPKFEVDGM